MWLQILELVLLAALCVDLVMLLILHIRWKRTEKALCELLGEEEYRRYMDEIKRRRRKTRDGQP